MHIAELLVDLGRHDEALEILNAHRFFPWEGRTHIRVIWVRCLTGWGEEYLTAAAEEVHRGTGEADAYKVFALRALGREDEAGELEQSLREWAKRQPDEGDSGAVQPGRLTLLEGRRKSVHEL